MNSSYSLARTLREDLQDNAQRFCQCFTGCWSALCCSASVIAVLLPASFIIQFIALLVDVWAYEDTNDDMYSNNSYGCFSSYNEDDCLCVLEIFAITLESLLMLFGVCVCVRSCCHQFDAQSCRYCYVCFIPVFNLLPGILSFVCCLKTMKFASGHKLTYGVSFYMFLVTGSALIVASLASVCGYICLRSCEVRSDYELQIGSDDADRETTPIIHARRPQLNMNK